MPKITMTVKKVATTREALVNKIATEFATAQKAEEEAHAAAKTARAALESADAAWEVWKETVMTLVALDGRDPNDYLPDW